MPFESEAQRKAMYAAAGNSNIGIPKQAAEKFIKHSTDTENPDEWLKNVLLVEMLKEDEIPKEETLLSTPEIKEDAGDIMVRNNSLEALSGHIEEITKLIKSFKKDEDDGGNLEGSNFSDADPCWEGYQQIGMKERMAKAYRIAYQMPPNLQK